MRPRYPPALQSILAFFSLLFWFYGPQLGSTLLFSLALAAPHSTFLELKPLKKLTAADNTCPAPRLLFLSRVSRDCREQYDGFKLVRWTRKPPHINFDDLPWCPLKLLCPMNWAISCVTRCHSHHIYTCYQNMIYMRTTCVHLYASWYKYLFFS